MYSQNKTLEKVKTFADAFFKILLIFVMAFPFFWMIITSLKTGAEANSVPPTFIPKKLIFEKFNYNYVGKDAKSGKSTRVWGSIK